jgi:membrane protein implicated in regulation of membrane protease activity
LSSYMGKKYYADRQGDSEEPLLNQRTQSLIGRKASLEEPITNGRGRIKLNDSIWMIEGPDLEAGQTVEVVAANSNRLTVIQA